MMKKNFQVITSKGKLDMFFFIFLPFVWLTYLALILLTGTNFTQTSSSRFMDQEEVLI